jgi:hypothetical protein
MLCNMDVNLVSHTNRGIGSLQKVLEHRMPKKIFRPEKEKVGEGLKNLHNEWIHDLCFPLCIIKVIKARRM